jgi:hypothetical protein
MIANLLIAGTCILLASGILLSRKRMQSMRRTREMRALARRMGWHFEAAPALDIIPDRKRLESFTVRMHQRIRNHLSSSVGEYRVAVFDLEYSTTDDEAIKGWEQTVVHVQSTRLRLPAFAVRPERVYHRNGDGVGGGDIDFDADPEFSRAYQLRGPDESAVRGAFGAEVRASLHRRVGTSADGEGSDLLIWHRGRLARPEEVAVLVQAAVDLAGHLHGNAAYQLAGRPYGNHGSRETVRDDARIPARRRKDGFYDLF